MAFKGQPKVFILEDAVEKYELTFYFHRHRQKRFHKFNWEVCIPAGIGVVLKCVSHEKLRALCPNRQIGIGHVVRKDS